MKNITHLPISQQKEYNLQLNVQSTGYIVLMFLVAIVMLLAGIESTIDKIILGGWFILCSGLLTWDNYKLKKLFLGEQK